MSSAIPDELKVPRHVAIIMDGNGRWAQERDLPRTEGHRAGAESVRCAVQTCSELGIEYLTLYAFSTENWNRPAGEVRALMTLLGQFLDEQVGELQANKIRLNAIGELDRLPLLVRRKLKRVMELTREFTAGTLTLALSYGSRAEIVAASRRLAEKVASGALAVEEITEEAFAGQLYTAGLPDPDLVIRTANEHRLSNFLLWQLSYAEFWVTDVPWPEFRREHLVQAVEDYNRRERRFGGVSHA